MRLLAVAVLTLSLFPDFRVRGAEPTDPKSESPAKPAPSGLKYLDQGQNDPRLKGYRTPEGFKLEIVTAEPTLFPLDEVWEQVVCSPQPKASWKTTRSRRS